MVRTGGGGASGTEKRELDCRHIRNTGKEIDYCSARLADPLRMSVIAQRQRRTARPPSPLKLDSHTSSTAQNAGSRSLEEDGGPGMKVVAAGGGSGPGKGKEESKANSGGIFGLLRRTLWDAEGGKKGGGGGEEKSGGGRMDVEGAAGVHDWMVACMEGWGGGKSERWDMKWEVKIHRRNRLGDGLMLLAYVFRVCVCVCVCAHASPDGNRRKKPSKTDLQIENVCVRARLWMI